MHKVVQGMCASGDCYVPSARYTHTHTHTYTHSLHLSGVIKQASRQHHGKQQLSELSMVRVCVCMSLFASWYVQASR